MNLLPTTANHSQAGAAVGVLEFLSEGQVLVRQTRAYLAQQPPERPSRRLVKMFYRQTAPKTIRRARDFAAVPELATLRERLLALAAELDGLRVKARTLL